MKNNQTKVLFVTSKSLGGSGKYITVLAAALKEKGIECELIYFPMGVQQDVEIEAAFSKVHHFSRKPNLSPITCWFNALEVAALLRSAKYDVVHTHTSLGGMMGRLGARLVGQESVFVGHTIHAFGADEFTPVPQKWIYWVIERGLDLITDGYVSPSQYMVDYGARMRLIDSKKATVIYNSLPLDGPPTDVEEVRENKRMEIGVDKKACMLLFCGRLEKQKGVDVLLEALSKVDSRTNVHLVICGVGEDESKLKQLELRLGLQGKVTWAGWQADVKPFYAAADIYIMPSRWESFGLVFLEAMNYSKPVISTLVQAVPEVVADGVTGLLSKSEDPVALAANIDALVADPGLQIKLGVAGKNRLVNKFHFSQFVDQHIAWYEAQTALKAALN